MQPQRARPHASGSDPDDDRAITPLGASCRLWEMCGSVQNGPTREVSTRPSQQRADDSFMLAGADPNDTSPGSTADAANSKGDNALWSSTISPSSAEPISVRLIRQHSGAAPTCRCTHVSCRDELLPSLALCPLCCTEIPRAIAPRRSSPPSRPGSLDVASSRPPSP